LFFGGVFKGLLDTEVNSVLINSALNFATSFLFQWLVLTGLMYLLIKGLRGNVIWKPVMVAAGVALVALVVQSVIFLALYAELLPNLNYPLEFLAFVPGEAEAAAQAIQAIPQVTQLLQISSIVQIAVYVWVIALGSFIVRYATGVAPASPLVPATTETESIPRPQQFGWLKCLLVSAVSFVLTITILGFLGIG
jgi:hypothetical protein